MEESKLMSLNRNFTVVVKNLIFLSKNEILSNIEILVKKSLQKFKTFPKPLRHYENLVTLFQRAITPEL